MSLPATLLDAARPVGHHRVAATVHGGGLEDAAASLFADGMRLALVSGHDDGTSMRAVYLFTGGPPDSRVELHVPVDRSRPQVPSLAGLSFPACRFERELSDLFGIEPVGHPQPRRLVLHQHWPAGWHPMRNGSGDVPQMVADAGSFPFVPVEGTGVYEIPVGPVHAGLIEPGHFRFWVVGETILRMKARLWFVHKGIERLCEGKDVASGLEIAERISGDTAVGHGLAYCLAVEDARQTQVPEDAQLLRSALLELERLYNHVADIGALCNDVGFGLAQAWALTLREQLLRLNRAVTGHRFLRGGVVPGGARVLDLPSEAELAEIGERFEELVELITSSALVMERFTGTAILDEAHARELGVVGVVGRASGLSFDARTAHPFFDLGAEFSPAVEPAGTCWLATPSGCTRSGHLCRSSLASSPTAVPLTWCPGFRTAEDHDHPPEGWGSPRAGGGQWCTGWSSAEKSGWSGSRWSIRPSSTGRLSRRALTDTIVPDFPLANKSFNLSYAGNDL